MPVRIDPKLWRFCTNFMAHATGRAWDKTMAGLTQADLAALAAYDELEAGGVNASTTEGPFIIGFENEGKAAGFLKEVEGAQRHGQDIPFEQITLDDARADAPMLTDKVGATYRMGGQRFIEPGPYCQAVADSIVQRGGTITTGAEVVEVTSTRTPAVKLATGERLHADNVVLATGAWLPKLAKVLGVTTLVQAGRGYSFSVETEEPATCPVYLPDPKIACTPYQGRFRIAGTMEGQVPCSGVAVCAFGSV
ncbi:FAD-binding oxidoreductase [Corynebacterium afermentans]|uniref:NAD(P)/FAD-dependent oxidoreductase n=1 Tax=Corynebacterium afermentans TaxID=38286 RepID=UPI002573482A|nr:FAD-binding oxidoreductase [Corynebacterium afermentans]MCG7292567.1 FAD-binding oxidoreductase [Corynebacterium afermentans]